MRFAVYPPLIKNRAYAYVCTCGTILYGELGLPNFTDSPILQIILHNLQELPVLENLVFSNPFPI